MVEDKRKYMYNISIDIKKYKLHKGLEGGRL